jgi:predicted glycogen debranching enzyme
MPLEINKSDEWLEADGLGGFASGTVSGIRTRRYHALLLTAMRPPTGRIAQINGFEAWVETPNGSMALTTQQYHPDTLYPDGYRRLETFSSEPWPTWRFVLEDGTTIQHEIFVPQGAPAVVVSWKLLRKKKGFQLVVRPLLSGRDYHSLHRENPDFRFDAEVHKDKVTWHPYRDLPPAIAWTNGVYEQKPEWYRNFLYEQERERGLDDMEDLASPGLFRWDLASAEAVCILAADEKASVFSAAKTPAAAAKKLRTNECRRRSRAPSRLHRSAEAFFVKRGGGQTIVAGYPWFTDWGRDTFIALRGLAIAVGKLDAARNILLTWAETVSEGMLPNRFTDWGDALEFNSVDASLWFIIAVDDFLQACKRKQSKLSRKDRKTLTDAVEAILEGYAHGTRYGIRLDDDGLLAAGQEGVQLTWTDAKWNGHVVTPRIGKPVEVQCLWLNAVWTRRDNKKWALLFERGKDTLCRRFWNEAGGFLYDVVDCGFRSGTVDGALRPNQVFAVGGLPLVLLEPEQATRVMETLEKRLWTPLGLRSLAPGDPAYAAHYTGSVQQRDQAYHNGTVWPWLAGPFVEGWVRVHGGSNQAKKEARKRFLQPFLDHLDHAGLGHVSEIADGDPPHTPRGCPFQAWSLGEVLRLDHVVLK